MDEHLAASWVAGLIGPFHQGAAAHLTDDLTSEFRPAAHLCFAIRTPFWEERVDFFQAHPETKNKNNQPDIMCNSSVWKKDGASHVVTGMSYGLETHCVMELDFGNSSDGHVIDREDAMEVLRKAADRLKNHLKNDSSDDLLYPEFPSSFEKIKVKLFADWKAPKSTCLSYPEAYQLCCKNISLLSASDRNKLAVPLTVWLHPLADVIKPAPKITPYRPLSSWVVDESLQFYIRLIRIQSKLCKSIQHPFADRESLDRLESYLSKFKKLFQREVSRMVRCIRTTTNQSLAGDTETNLSGMISAFAAENSFFNLNLLEQWIGCHVCWMEARDQIQRILPKVPISIVNRKDRVIQQELESTIIYQLPYPFPEGDLILEEMKNYLDKDEKKRNNNVSSDCKLSCRIDPDKKTEMEKWSRRVVPSVQQFGQFISENAANTNKVYYQIRIGGDAEPEFKLFHNGEMKRYALPSPPDRVRVLENQRGAITLSWNGTQVGLDGQVTGFLVEYRPTDYEKDGDQWTRIKSTDLKGQLKISNLLHGKEYYFQVATETVVGRSKFSLPIGPIPVTYVCRPPRNVTISSTDTAIHLSWELPLHLDLEVTGFDVEYWPDGQKPRLSFTQEKSLTLNDLNPETVYNVRVAIVCGSMGSGRFSSTLQTKTLVKPERLALTVRRVSQPSSSRANPSSDDKTIPLAWYDIPLRQAKVKKRLVFGYPNLKFQHKTILLIGATGAGKTTLINSMINYVLGVEWDDNFRFRMVVESNELSQAHSQTNDITTYDVFHSRGSRVDYSLTIVDTPGFGDTKGLEQDKEILEKYRHYFEQLGEIQELEAVCFVVKAPSHRLTATETYILDSVLSVFGNDIKDNIRVMTTFADEAGLPPVLISIQEYMKKSAKDLSQGKNTKCFPFPTDADGVPLHYKFRNSSFFADKDGPNQPIDMMMDSFNKRFFAQNVKQFESFFQDLHRMPTTSLSLTKEVLQERKRLEVMVEGLQQQIHVGLVKLEEFNQLKRIFAEHKDDIVKNKEFHFEVSHVKPKQTDISGTGYWISNCQKCQWTCHYPCESPNDKDRSKCFSMDKNGNCNICPGRCYYTEHLNQKFKWEQQVVKVQKSSEEVRLRYQTASNQEVPVQYILDRISNEFDDSERELKSLVDRAHPLVVRLNEIALRPHPLAAPDYIDLLIQVEEQDHGPGYLDRIESLRRLRELAIITSKLMSEENVLNANPI